MQEMDEDSIQKTLLFFYYNGKTERKNRKKGASKSPCVPRLGRYWEKERGHKKKKKKKELELRYIVKNTTGKK